MMLIRNVNEKKDDFSESEKTMVEINLQMTPLKWIKIEVGDLLESKEKIIYKK